MNNAIDLALVYHAVSGEPADYDQLARLGSREYAQAGSDAFRKRELLGPLQQQFDATIATLAKRPYVWLGIREVSLGDYDLDTHSFPIYGISAERDHPYRFDGNGSGFQLRFTNGDDFRAYRLDEQRAKPIQALLAKHRYLYCRVYCVAQKADPGATVVQAFITAIGFYEQDSACAANSSPDCTPIIQL